MTVLGYGAVGFYFLPMASFQGDLTRIGMMPESQFGWHKPQPAINPKLIQQSSLQEADVLVIGDSFSDNPLWHGLVWQTALTQRGLKVRTESWASMRGICADFAPWLKAQGFHGQFVILQIIERNISKGLEDSLACQHMQPHPSALADRRRSPPAVTYDPEHKDFSGRFSVGIQTALNYRNYMALSSMPDFKSTTLPNGANIARVKNGCELFSHSRCDDALFLAEDSAAEVDTHALENIAIINKRMQEITPIWAFVPNKSTAYLYPEKRFWNEAEQRFSAPNLLRMTQRAISEKTVDLYPANNTHFSTTGYLLMGEEIYKHIAQKQSDRH